MENLEQEKKEFEPLNLKGYQYDNNGFFLYETVVNGDPIANEPVFHLNETLVPLNKEKENFVQRFNEKTEKWEYVESHIGTTVYNKQTKEPHEIKEHGPIGKEFTTLKPSELDKWDSKQNKWIIDDNLLEKAIVNAKKSGVSQVDDLIGSIYLKFTRFDKEYQRRESQAREFKTNNYQGEVPLQVNAFASNVGIPPQQATDIILQQADKLNHALDTLGNLRMKKYQIEQQTTLEGVERVTKELLKQINEVASKL